MAILMPPKKKEEKKTGAGQILGGIGTVVGGILGGVFTGGAGVAPGAAAGGAIGSTVGGFVDSSQPEPEEKPVHMLAESQDTGAVSRKLASMQQQSQPMNDVVEAGKALNNMPPDIQEEYKPVLMSTYARMRQSGGKA